MPLQQLRRKNIHGLDDEFNRVYSRIENIESRLVVSSSEPLASIDVVWYNPDTAMLYVYKEPSPGAGTYSWEPIVFSTSDSVLYDGGVY